MSRYSKQIDGGKKTLVWGYDRPMSEYFLQLFDNTVDPEDLKDDVIFSISSYTTLDPHPDYPDRMNWSNGEIVELIKKDYSDDIPDAHVDCILLDLPF